MCAWWNPADWLKGAGAKVGEGIIDAISGLGQKVREDPRIVLVPTGAVTAGVVLYHAAKAYGQKAGDDFTIQQVIDEVM